MPACFRCLADVVQKSFGTTECSHHAVEVFGCLAGGECLLQLGRGLAGGRQSGALQKFAAKRQHHILQALVLLFAREEIHGAGNFDGIAGATRQRFIHVGDEGGGVQASAIGDRDKAFRQFARALDGGHESAGAALHVEHEMVEARRQLFERMEAVMSGTDSTVAVTSRMA
jgi:hypothetical protein